MKRASHGILVPYSARLTEGLLAYYSFNTSLTQDDTGNGNDLTAVNSPTTTDGVIQLAAKVDNASNQYFDSSFFLIGETEFSMGGWMYAEGSSGGRSVWGFDEGAAVNWQLTMQVQGVSPNRNIGFLFAGSGFGSNFTGSGDVTLDAYNFAMVSVSKKQKKVRLFVNNNEYPTVYGGDSNPFWAAFSGLDYQLRFGLSIIDSPISGQYDEVGIWNRALSDSEITYLYNSGIGRTYTPQGII